MTPVAQGYGYETRADTVAWAAASTVVRLSMTEESHLFKWNIMKPIQEFHKNGPLWSCGFHPLRITVWFLGGVKNMTCGSQGAFESSPTRFLLGHVWKPAFLMAKTIPSQNQAAKVKINQSLSKVGQKSCYHLVMTNSLPWKDPHHVEER